MGSILIPVDLLAFAILNGKMGPLVRLR
jgi:hypothetical protein